MKGKNTNTGQNLKLQSNQHGKSGQKSNKGAKNQAILTTGNANPNIAKKVTFNQNRQSSQENMSSDRYSSMNSKSYSNNIPVQNHDITHTLDSQEMGMSSKKFSVQISEHANTQNQFNTNENFGTDYNDPNMLKTQNSKDSKKSKLSSNDGDAPNHSYGSSANQPERSSRRSSQNVLNSRDLQPIPAEEEDINEKQISVTYVEQEKQSECLSGQYTMPIQDLQEGIFQVNQYPSGLFTNLNSFDSMYEDHQQDEILFARRQKRVDQMQKRLRVLEEQNQPYGIPEDENQSNIQSESLQKPDSSQQASQQASGRQEQFISGETDPIHESEPINSIIEDEASEEADLSAQGQDEDVSASRQDENTNDEALQGPEPIHQSIEVSNLDSRKKVCISQEPRQPYNAQTHGVSQAQSDGTFLSVSSFDEKYGYGKPGNDKQEYDQGSNKSIISEQDSKYEECTPAANKEYIGDFSTQLEQNQMKNLKKTDPVGISKPESHLKQRGLHENKKSMSISGNNDIIDDRKAKPVRTQTMGKQPDTKNRLQHESPGTKSKGGFTNLDQDSMKSLKFISNKGGKKGKKKNVSQKKRDSAIGSGFNHTEKINIVNMNYKKQGTQDEKRGFVDHRGEVGRDSRNNSLNLTVDNQLDQLSVNFGNQKFGYQHFNKQNSTDQPSRQNDSTGKDRPPKATTSIFSSQNQKQESTPRDYILAKSKNRIDPRSNAKFNRQISNDSRYKSPRNQFSPHRQQDRIEQDKSNKSVISGGGNVSASEFYHSSVKNKQKEELIGIYMKKPYKVMSIKQIRQKEQRDLRDPMNARLFQAENTLKIHTGYNSKRYQQKTSQYDKRGKNLIKNLNPSRVLLQDNASRGKTRDSQGFNSSHKVDSRRTDQRLNHNQYIFQNNQAPHVSQMSKETDFMPSSSINAQYGKVSPMGNHEFTVGEYTTDSKSQLNMNYSTGRQQQKVSKVEQQRLETEFKIRFYDNILYQMDKQQDNINSHLKSLKTKQNLCNVYGQTFSPIDYGNASYAPHISPQLRKESRSPKDHKRHNKNDILKPLGQELRQKNHMKVEDGYEDPNKMKLYLNNVNDFMMNEQIIAESARVKKEIVLDDNQSKQINPTTRGSVQNRSNDNGGHLINYESNREYNQSTRRQEEEIGFQQIIEEYDMKNIQNSEQLRQLLDISNTMGYSNQQIKHLKEKHYKIKSLEGSLHHLVNKMTKNRISSSAKKQNEQLLPFKKQLTGFSQDIANNKKQQRHIQKLSFDREIKTYYPEPNENLSKAKENSPKRDKPMTGNQLKPSRVIQNKESYHQKVKSLMYGSQNLGGTRSNDNSALGAVSKRTGTNGTKTSVEPEDINVKDYIGNKINLRRSIEQMNYDTKQFKRNSKNDQIDLKQELMNSQQSKNIDHAKNLQVNMHLSEPSKQHSRANTMTKVVNTMSQKGKGSNTNNFYNSNSEKPKFDFIKQNRKNILPFAENQICFEPDIKRANVGLFSPIQNPQIQNIMGSQRQSVNLKNQHGQNLSSLKKNQFHQTQQVQEEVRTSRLVAEIKKGSQDSRVIEKLKNAEHQISNNTYNNQRFQHQKAAYNTGGKLSEQKQKERGSDFKQNPHLENSPPIRKQRSRILQDNKGSKTRLIQSGQHIIGQPHGIHSSVTNPQIANSNTQLGYQFKNVSPRVPGFQNNLHELQKKSSDLQNAIESMNLDHKTRQPGMSSTYQTHQGNNNILASSDYSQGKQLGPAKQTQILRGVLNQQRRLNRIIQNNGVIGTNSTARADGNISANQKNPGKGSISNQSSSIASQIMASSSINGADSYNMNLKPNRNINQSVNNPVNHQQSNDMSNNVFANTLDPHNNRLNQEQQQNLDYIQQIQSGVHNVGMQNDHRRHATDPMEEIRDQSQQMSTIKSSLNAPAQ